jgi:diacylglycerol kinase family enzyme
MVGMGLDAAIVRDVERRQWVKRIIGDWFFVWTGLRLFLAGRYDRRRPHIRLSVGTEPGQWRDGLYLAVVQNLSPFTYLGRRALRLCPEASLGAGLDCFAMDTMRSLAVLPILVSAFGSARHTSHPHVAYVQDQRTISLQSDVPLPIQADGEFLGERTEMVIESIPDALTVVC